MIPALLRVLCFRINGNNICPCSLVLRYIVANMSKNSVFELLSAPIWGEKRCKGIAISNTGQIFLKLFFFRVINKDAILYVILLINKQLIAIKKFKDC